MNIKERFAGRSKLIVTLIAIIFLLIIIAGIIWFFSSKTCNNFSCFQTAMSQCQKAEYVNEESIASWRYSVIGQDGDNCVVRVKLLTAKEGTLEIDKLMGYSMDCDYPLGIASYPEKNLDNCHGRLKEELQNIIIKKLYSYILDNVGQVGDNLKSAV